MTMVCVGRIADGRLFTVASFAALPMTVDGRLFTVASGAARVMTLPRE
jgi:hypothetical protein